MARGGCWAWEFSFWSWIQLERGDSVFVPDCFHALGVIFPSWNLELQEQGGSELQEFLGEVQLSRGKYSSSCLFQQRRDLVADPSKFPGIF